MKKFSFSLRLCKVMAAASVRRKILAASRRPIWARTAVGWYRNLAIKGERARGGVGGERSPRLNHSDGCRIDLRNRLVRRRLERWRLDDDWVLVITLCPSVYRSRQKEEEKTNKKNWGKGRRRWRWQKPLRQKWIGPPTRILHKHINKTSDSTWGRIYRRQRCCALPFFSLEYRRVGQNTIWIMRNNCVSQEAANW